MSILTALLGAGLVAAIATLALVASRTAKLRTRYSSRQSFRRVPSPSRLRLVRRPEA
jgi:hypothetical protein